jgi:hypothetical protein
MEPKKEMLQFAESLNLIDLYALDLELNVLIRSIADNTL